jgi:ABC-type phosphate/phosphonate transport system substrate-binding protein
LRKNIFVIAGLTFWLAGGASKANAYFIDLGGGVRPTGMGEAFVAVADDINAMQYNPAGLSRLEQVEIAGMYSNLYTNLDLRLYNQGDDHLGYNLLAATVPLPELQGGVGLTWKHFDTVFYQENEMMLGYGRRLWAWGGEPGEKRDTLDLGCNLKWLQWQLSANQFTADQNYYPYSEFQKNAFTADAGLMLRLFSNYRLGVSAENIIPANVGLTTTENVPAVYRLGLAYSLFLGSVYADSLLATVEVSNRNHLYNPKAGLESWHFHHCVALRAGADQDNLSCGFSYRYPWNATSLALQLDYAFSYPWHMADTAGSQWVGMTIGWDMMKPREEDQSQALARKTQSALRAQGIALGAGQTAAQSLATALAIAKAGGPEACYKLKAISNELGYTVETAKLATEIVRADATEAKSSTLTAMAAEAVQAETTTVAAAQEIQLLLKEAERLAENQKSALLVLRPEPVREIPPLPEKFNDRMVIGIETKIVTDFGSLQEMEPAIQTLAVALQKTIGMKLEWRLLSPAELLLALHEGELDGVLAYETELDKYKGKGRLMPVLTAEKNGRTDQACCLIVRADSTVTTLDQIRGKRLGYSNSAIAGHLDQLFFNGAMAKPEDYFASMEKQKNARDSLWALQMEAVDVLAEYAYILDIAQNIPGIKVRVIAKSSAAPHVPLWLRTSRYPEKNLALQKFVAALRGIQQDSAGRSLLQLFRIERLVADEDQ